VLFLEYIPQNAEIWLKQQLNSDNESALEMIEKNLLAIISFMKAHGMLHSIIYCFNILTRPRYILSWRISIRLEDGFDVGTLNETILLNI
jgi:hypothetical protein